MADNDEVQDINMDDYIDAVKRGESSPLPFKELEGMRKDIVLYTTKDESIDLAMDIKSHTAYITGDFKHIRLTYANVPRSLRDKPNVVLYLLRGYLLHETGHVFLTKKMEKQWNEFKKRHKQTQLAANIENIIEDARVNYRMPIQFATGDNMKDALLLHGETWLNGIKNNCVRDKAQLEKQGKEWPGTMENGAVVSLMWLKGLYGRGLNIKIDQLIKEWFPNATAEQLEDIDAGAHDIDVSKMLRVWKGGIEQAAKNLYVRCQKYAEPGRIGDGRGKGPTQPGSGDDGQVSGGGGGGEELDPEEEGDGTPVPGQGQSIDKSSIDPKWIPTDYESGEMEGDIEGPLLERFDKIQKDADEEREKKSPGQGGAGGHGPGAGGGDSKMIPPNQPNPNDFNMRRSRLLQEINKMRNMLKIQSKPVHEIHQYQRSGRLMTPIVSKVMGSAMRREVSNIYSRTKTRFEKQDATLFLLIDVSGSTNVEMMKDAMVLLAEAAGDWIPDENFGIYTFGDNFKKVKDIDEQYENTRYRIGGVDAEGGTNVYLALEHLEKTIKGIKKPGTKTLLIVTDFGFYEDANAIKQKLQEIADHNTIIVGICHMSGATHASQMTGIHEAAKQFGDFALVDMLRVEDLPANFFAVYKQIAFEGMDSKSWDKARREGRQ